MTDTAVTMTFEDIPMDVARTMGSPPRIDPEIYAAIEANLMDLGQSNARRMFISQTFNYLRLKRWVQRVAKDLGMQVTTRRMPGGVLFWLATAEDIREAKHVADRLHGGRRMRVAGD